MRLIRTLGVVVVVLALALAASSAQAAAKGAKGKKAKKPHAIHGVVTQVEKDKDKDSGTITVKVGGHKAKNGKPAKEGVEKTFKVTDATKFTRVSGKKGAEEVKKGEFREVKDGEHIVLEVEGDKALDVKVREHHHKKKNA